MPSISVSFKFMWMLDDSKMRSIAESRLKKLLNNCYSIATFIVIDWWKIFNVCEIWQLTCIFGVNIVKWLKSHPRRTHYEAQHNEIVDYNHRLTVDHQNNRALLATKEWTIHDYFVVNYDFFKRKKITFLVEMIRVSFFEINEPIFYVT